jgi:hypothetical protein
VNGKYLYRIRKGFNKFATFMKPNPPISKLLKHIKQQENTEEYYASKAALNVRLCDIQCSTL